MITETIFSNVPHHLYAFRTKPIRIVIIHATRGGTSSSGWEYIATKNWFTSPNNPGAMASRIIGPNGEHCIALPDSRIPQWSAGYGSIGPPTEYLLDDYAISYEVAQPNNDTPFTDAQYERLAIEAAKDCKTYGIPAVLLDSRGGQFYPVPAGITRHDRTANGVKLGKSDPGKMWDDNRFMTLLKSKLSPPPVQEDWFDMATEEELRTIIREEIDKTATRFSLVLTDNIPISPTVFKIEPQPSRTSGIWISLMAAGDADIETAWVLRDGTKVDLGVTQILGGGVEVCALDKSHPQIDLIDGIYLRRVYVPGHAKPVTAVMYVIGS